MAKHLGLSNTRDLFLQGLVEARQGENGYWRPMIRFRNRPIKMCPFLQNNLTEDKVLQGLCGLHPNSKPLICCLAPLGRVIDLAISIEQWEVYEPSPGCPGMNQGPERSLKNDIAILRSRLDKELEFFSMIEQAEPCPDANSARDCLFSFDTQSF